MLRLDSLYESTSSHNHLLQSLTVFSSLKTLYFQDNDFPIETHCEFSCYLLTFHLRVLIAGVVVKSQISYDLYSFLDLKNLSKLENLILDGSRLDKNVLSDLGELRSLKVISLFICELEGTLPNQGIQHYSHAFPLKIFSQ